MKSSIAERIARAEERWLDRVSRYNSMLFSETFIPSHDQRHHQRVWNICKSLLTDLDSYNSIADQDLVEGILLASWFHDTGMVHDSGEMHGALGRQIFERFISLTPKERPVQYKNVLYAIEHHDTKARSAYPDLTPDTPPCIIGILSMADDLDALGSIGIYRYSEIYLKRGVPARFLGIKALSNVRRRFTNILESCTTLPLLTDPYRPDYELIEQFFNLYNQQLLIVSDPEKVLWGHLGVVNLIRAFSVQAEIRPEDFAGQPEISLSGAFVKTYFNKLLNELDKTVY